MKVFLVATMSADGYIARDEKHLSTTWNTNSDRVLFTRITKRAGVVVCGYTTYATFAGIRQTLKDRRLIVYTRQKREPVEGVEFTSEPPLELLKRLESEGAKGLAVCGGTQIYKMFM